MYGLLLIWAGRGCGWTGRAWGGVTGSEEEEDLVGEGVAGEKGW